MAKLTIQIPQKDFRKLKARAHREGFKNPTEWARVLVEKNMEVTESPKMNPEKIISEMQKTGRYSSPFLRSLSKSLKYADKAA